MTANQYDAIIIENRIIDDTCTCARCKCGRQTMAYGQWFIVSWGQPYVK